MQSYVNDLCEQNTVLVQTVEELEKEANNRVAMLEGKLKKTAQNTKASLTVCRHYLILNISSGTTRAKFSSTIAVGFTALLNVSFHNMKSTSRGLYLLRF